MSFRKPILIATIVIFSGALLFSLLLYHASKILTRNEKITANVLVVEGWIYENALNKALTEFKKGDYQCVIVTGDKLIDERILYVNSFLVYHPYELINLLNNKDSIVLELSIQSSLGMKDSARFAIWLNDRIINDFFTTQFHGKYIIKLDQGLNETDSLLIQFKNDKVDESGDRNLVVQDVSVNGVQLNHHNSHIIRDEGRPFGRNRRNISTDTYAGLAANYFIQMGIPSDQVIPIPNYRNNLRRTYGNARALREWFKNAEIKSDIQGINVVTMDYHSYRTWKTYKKLLRNVSNVGIISCNDASLSNNEELLKNKKIKESLALVYYWVLILPWI
jgi:hypothetical protein